MLRKFRNLSFGIKDWLSNYKLRHLSIGKVKQLDKTRYDKFEIVNISWDVHCVMSLYLAVIIRDYLRFFIKNTQVPGECVVKAHWEEYKNSYGDEFIRINKDLKQEWTDIVNSIADEFDELVKVFTSEVYEDLSIPEWDEKMAELARKAFADLGNIYNDLWW